MRNLFKLITPNAEALEEVLIFQKLLSVKYHSEEVSTEKNIIKKTNGLLIIFFF